MKILLACENFLPSIGGVELHTELLAHSLVELGHDVTVYCFKKYKTAHTIKGVTVYYQTGLPAMIKAFSQADLIISNGELSIKAVFWSLLLQKKVLCFYHMALPYLKPGKSISARVKNMLRRVLVYYPVGYIAVTHAVAKEINVPASRTVLVVLNPIRDDISRAYAQYTGDTSIQHDIVYCGRLIKGKGIFVLRDALNELAQRSVYLRVLLIGEGPALQEFQEGLHPGVQFTHQAFTQAARLVELYHASKIMVLPSTEHQEGSGLVLIEFMHADKPVIVSDQPALIETVDECGIVVQQGNSTQLAEAIEKMLQPDVYEAFQEKIKTYKVRFRKAVFTAEIQKIINRFTK